MTVRIRAFLTHLAKVRSWGQGLSLLGSHDPTDSWVGEEQWVAGFPPPWTDYAALRWWRGP